MGRFSLVLLFLRFAFPVNSLFAQSATNYTVQNQTNGVLFQDASGNTIDTSASPNLVFNWVSNQNSAIQPIGFPFVFMGRLYTHFIAGVNGQLALGLSGSPSGMLSANANNILLRPVAYPPGAGDNAALLAPFWDRMTAPRTGPTIRSVITGTAPNRCRVVMWNSLVNNPLSSAPPDAVFQLRMYEGTGVVEYVYGKMSIGASSSNVSASIGFSSGNSGGAFLALQNLTDFTFTGTASLEPATRLLVNSSAPGSIAGLNAASNTQCRNFRFLPPALSGNPVTDFRVTDTAATLVTLQWSDTYSNELRYHVLRSTDNSNFNYVGSVLAGNISYTDSNLTLGTTYYWKLVAATEGATSITASISATTRCAMQGVFAVGTGGRYASLRAGLADLRLRGIRGNVVFELQGSYDASAEQAPLVFPKTAELLCLGTNSVTVRPASDVQQLSFTGNSSPAILLDSVHYLIIDGRPGGLGNQAVLTLTNNQAAPVIRLVNASRNRFRYLRFGALNVSVASQEGLVMMQGTKASGCDSNSFRQCEFFSTLVGGNAKATLFYSAAIAGKENGQDSVIDSRFHDFSRNALWLENYNDNWVISGNSFYQTVEFPAGDRVEVLKINTPASAGTHLISGSHFGGSMPGITGNPVNSKYNAAYYGISVSGNAQVTGNRFGRLKFSNSTAGGSGEIRLISAEDPNGGYHYQINDNEFGAWSGGEDSIILCNYSTNAETLFSCIKTATQSEVRIFNNRASQLSAYAGTMGTSLKVIVAIGGLSRVYDNSIGQPAAFRSIVNNSAASMTGIETIGSLTSVNGNRLCRMVTTLDDGLVTLTGIDIRSGNVDSVCNNQVLQFQNGLPGGNSYAAIVGIKLFPSFGGGSANLVEGNLVHSLQHHGRDFGGTVAGMLIGSYLTLRRNFVHSISSASNAITSIYGISIPDKESILENNMVRLGIDSMGNSIPAGNLNFIGVSGGHVMTHNSIYIGGSNVTDNFIGSIAYAFLGNALPATVFNNIFCNMRSNEAVSASGRHQCAAIDISYSLNNNLYYFGGNGGIMGTFNGTRYGSFAEWKNGTGLDPLSRFDDPKFIAPSAGATSVDLHLLPGTPAESAGGGAAVGAITTSVDFDGEQRSLLTPVDIGADAGNFTCPAADAGPDAVIVEGGTIRIGSPGMTGLTYQWTSLPPGFTSTLPDPLVSPEVSTLYKLAVGDGACVAYDSVLVRVLNLSPVALCVGGNKKIGAGISGTVYRWQQNSGSGYAFISDGSNYTGTQTDSLQLTALPSSFYGYKFRCVVDGLTGAATTLKFENVWTGNADNRWSNPANWSCGILPDGGTDVVIPAGNVLLDVNGVCRSIRVLPGALFTIAPGVRLTVTH